MDYYHYSFSLVFLGNYFSFPLFFGVDFLFGSIATLLIVVLYGRLWGVIAAIIISAYTYVLWGHPFAIIIFSLEALSVGFLVKKTGKSLIYCAGLFWLLLGIPAVFFFYKIVMHVEINATILIMLKQSINGIFNALLASLIILFIKKLKLFNLEKRQIKLQELLSNVIISLIFISILFLMVYEGRADMNRIENNVLFDIKTVSSDISRHMRSWFRQHLHAVNELAKYAGQKKMVASEELQLVTKTTKELFPDFHNMYIADAEATTIAFYPPVNERNESTIGLNFSDREYYRELKATHGPVVSKVFMGRGGVFSPIITLSSPVLKDDQFLGFAVGALDLLKVRGIIQKYAREKQYNLTLVDSENRMIASTIEGLEPMQAFNPATRGEIRFLKGFLYQRIPTGRNIPVLKQFQNSYYVQETFISKELNWKLIVEYPLSFHQNYLYSLYIRYLSMVLVFVVASFILAAEISRRLTQPLAQLAELTSYVPDMKMLNVRRTMTMPVSFVKEINSLVTNFASMFQLIEANFHELHSRSVALEKLNDKLKENINDLETAKEALRESERKFATLFQMNPAGIFITDLKKGRVLEFNNSFIEITGYDPGESIGRTSLEMGFWQNQTDLGEISRVLEESGSFRNLEFKYRNRSGKMRDGLFSSEIVDIQNEPCIITTMFDITESKHAQEVLRKTEETYHNILQTTMDGFWLLNRSGELMDTNPAYCRMSGYSRSELLEKHVSSLDFYESPEDLAVHIQKTIKDGSDRFESVHKRKDGSLYEVEISAIYIPRGDDLVVFIRDISEQKREERERRKLEAQLRQSHKMEAIGTLAGGIAHDFNNILSAIIGYTELAMFEAEKGTISKKNLQGVYKAGFRAKDLVNQILTVARQTDEEIQPIQIDTIARESLKLIRSSIPTTIKITQDIAGGSLIMANAARIQQIFINLCTNAAQDMEDSGGELKVKLTNVTLNSESVGNFPELKPGEYARVTVSDTGGGISPNIIESIFEPYYTTKRPGEGTGMGLALVHGIVKSYGGEIGVESEIGKGSCFYGVFTRNRKMEKGKSKSRGHAPNGQ